MGILSYVSKLFNYRRLRFSEENNSVFHELGHAILGYLWKPSLSVELITIDPDEAKKIDRRNKAVTLIVPKGANELGFQESADQSLMYLSILYSGAIVEMLLDSEIETPSSPIDVVQLFKGKSAKNSWSGDKAILRRKIDNIERKTSYSEHSIELMEAKQVELAFNILSNSRVLDCIKRLAFILKQRKTMNKDELDQAILDVGLDKYISEFREW